LGEEGGGGMQGGIFFGFFANLKYTIVSHTKDFFKKKNWREMILIRHILKKKI
jgi:hypothetical protein